MARKGRGPTSRERRRSGGLSLLLAYAFGLLCVVGGVLVLVFGSPHSQDGSEVTAKDLTSLGAGMIVLGLLAIGLTMFLQRSRK